MRAYRKNQRIGIALIAMITTGTALSTVGHQSVSLSIKTNGRLVCPGDKVTFVCETRGSSIIAWSSEEYIGQDGRQLQFIALDTEVHRIKHGIGDTVATLTAKRMEGGVQLLQSTLCVTAMSMYPNPSSVKCIHGDERSRTANFNVIAPPNVPRNVSLTVEHTAENCVVKISWRGPDNLAEAPVSNYTITVTDTDVINGSVQTRSEIIGVAIDDTVEPDRDFSSSFTVPYCGSYVVTLQATNVCGHESPIDREEITLEEDCGITQDLICIPDSEADTTALNNHYSKTTAVPNNKNAADILPQALIGVTIGVTVVAFSIIIFIAHLGGV